jgi:hypothetical protein
MLRFAIVTYLLFPWNEGLEERASHQLAEIIACDMCIEEGSWTSLDVRVVLLSDNSQFSAVNGKAGIHGK